MKEKNFFEKVKDTIEDALNLNDEPTHYRETVEGRNDTRLLDQDQVDISDFEVPETDDIETIDNYNHDLPKASFDPNTLPIDDHVEDFISNKVKSENIEPLTFQDDIEKVKPHIETVQPEFHQEKQSGEPIQSEDIIPRTFEDTEPEKIRFDTPSLDSDLGHDDKNMGMSPSIPMEENDRKFDDERFEHSDLTGENPNLDESGTVFDDDPVHTLDKNIDRTLMDDPVAMNEEFIHDPVNSPNRGYKEEPEYMDADAALNIEQDENMQDASEEASFEDELSNDDGVHY